jgi:peptidoglycan LD-endopeptidase CwlK
MPADLVKRLDLDLLFPDFLERLLALLADCRARGADFFAISGHRAYAEQDDLYAQGRTKPGRKVTDARGGESAHNFGLAADLCRDGDLTRAGLQPDWREESYAILGILAPQHGLVWGGHWRKPDRPHVNFPGYVTATQLELVRRVYESEGLKQSWRLVIVPPLYCLPEVA